jgi:hypothetical protein
MKKLVRIMIVIFVLTLSMLYGESAGVLTDVLKPDGIEISEDKLYVIEGTKFHVYNLTDLKPVTTFGKKGVGPGELKPPRLTPNRLSILDDTLIAEDAGKLILFSKDFKLLKEIKKKDIMTSKIVPIGENFVAFRMSSGNKKVIFSLFLLDPEFQVIKELCRQETFDRQKELIMIRDGINFSVYKNKIYVEKSEKEFLIEVFDAKGNSLLKINQKSDPPPVTEAIKKARWEELKMDRIMNIVAKREGGWENFEKTGTFTYPEKFPHIRDMVVSDDKIYVSTFDKKNNKEKYIVMDLKGKVLNTVYMPIPISSPFIACNMGRENRFYDIKSNKYYYLVLNEDEDTYELHVQPFK